jgi:hypothetical protein
LHIAEDSLFLEESKITGFEQVQQVHAYSIKFGTKQKHFLSQKMLESCSERTEQITSSTTLIQLGLNNQLI